MASTLFVEVANAAAFEFHLEPLRRFAEALFFRVALREDVFAPDLTAAAGLFDAALPRGCEPLART